MAKTKDNMKKELEAFRKETINQYNMFLDKVKDYIRANGTTEGDYIKLYRGGGYAEPFPVMIPNDDNPEWNEVNEISALALDKNNNIVMFAESVGDEETDGYNMPLNDVSLNLALRIIEEMI